MLIKQSKKFLLSFAILLFIISAFGLAFFCFVPTSQAAVEDYEQGIGDLVLPGIGVEVSLVQTVVNIINIFLSLLGLIAVILIMYGGFVWMTARGSAEQVEKAKKIISRTLIGLAVILLSYLIVYMVMNFVLNWAENQLNPDPEPVCQVGVIDENLCRRCVGPGFWVPYTGPLGNCDEYGDLENFKALEVNTSHVDNNPAENVRLCSNVQVKFNNSVSNTSFNEMLSGEHLKITDNGGQIISKQENWQASNNYLSYINSDLYLENTSYKLYLPNSLEDGRGNKLTECLALPNCVVSGTNFVWDFITGTEVDDQPPSITTTIPENGSINVSLSPYIKINFDEEINALSVTPDSIQIFDSQNTRIDNVTSFDISTSRISFSFTSDLNEFENYRVVIAGVEDMCNNPMASAYEFVFTTGNMHSSIYGYYPTSNNVCPDETISFDFSVSMEGNLITFSLFDGSNLNNIALSAGETEKIISGFGKLSVTDSNFKSYEFQPDSLLKINNNYHAYVDTDKQINEQGDFLIGDWTFKTSTQEDCSCEPYISRLSPYQGGPGECLTVMGRCLLGKNDYTVSPISINFNNQQVAVASGSYTDRSITTVAPSDLTMDQENIREVEVSYKYKEDLSGAEKNSNKKIFYVITNDQAQGPCLYRLNPSSGKAGDNVTARGIRFGNSVGDLIFQLNINSVINNWTDTEIDSLVPDLAQSGDVFVKRTDNKISNPVYFEIRSDTPQDLYLMVINDSRCEMVESAIDVFPSPNPRSGSVGMCRNIVISARFNKLINDSTVNSNNIKVYECADTEKTPDEGGCDVSNLVQGDLSVFIYQYSQEGFKFVPSNILKPNHYYKITLSKQGLVAEDHTKLRDDYSWYFKVQNSENNCDAKYIDVNPSEYFTRINGEEIKYQSSAFADNCIEIPANNLTWTWRSSEPSIAVISVSKFNVATTTIVGGTNAGQTDIIASTLGKEDKGKLTYDPDKCFSNLDCVDYYGDGNYMCTGSICDETTRRCTPVIKTLKPDKGPAGRWVTVQGCYFENTKGTGKVEFGSLEAGYPCGVSWQDKEIIVSVPTVSADEKVKVTTRHGLVSNQIDFIIDSMCGSLIRAADFVAIPGLCGLRPQIARSGDRIILRGENLIIRSSRNPDDNRNKSECAVDDLDCDNQKNMCEQSGFNYTFLGYTINGQPMCCGDDFTEFFINSNDSHSCDSSQGCCPSVDYYIKDGVCVDDCAIGTPFMHRVLFNNLEATEYGEWGTDNVQVNVPENAVGGYAAVSFFGCSSNWLSFTLAGQSCDGDINTPSICESNQSLCPAGLVCQKSTCTCELPAPPEPLLVIDSSIIPSLNEDVECLNIVVGATFNQKVKVSTLNSSNIKLEWYRDDGCDCERPNNIPSCALNAPGGSQSLLARVWLWIKKIIGVQKIYAAQGRWCLLSGTIQSFSVDNGVSFCNNINGCTEMHFSSSNILYPSKLYRMVIVGNDAGVEAESGGILENGDYSWQFRTTDNAQICKLTDVKIVPESYIFTKDKEQFTFIAKAMSNNKEIFTSASYPFAWSWSKKEKDESAEIITISASDNNENLITANNKNGQATLYATASTTDVGFYDKKTGSSAITNFLCENLVTIKDDRGASNYTTMYCRDNSPDLLPNATQQNKDYTGQDILTEKFVLIEDSSDAIGIRVYKNTDKLSSEQWYKSKAPNQSGSVSHIDIDGYDGAQDGRSIYVTAVNHKGGLYYNMYIMSYNDRALVDSINIFNQLVENWQFNDNITDLEKRDALHRDVRRIYDLADIRQYLEEYKNKNNFYPKLSAGSYVKQEATSLWPSWQQTLGVDLGKNLPVDPINKFARHCSNNTNKNCWENSDCEDNGLCVDSCPADYDAVSCWNSVTHNFICPAGSHIYWYATDAQGTSFNIYANMEYEAWSKDDTCKDYKISSP